MNTTTHIRNCHQFFFNVSSNGLWENLNSPEVIFGYSLPLLEIQILLVISLIFASNIVFQRIGISQVASHMLAGLILGPQLFDLNAKSSQKLSLDPALNGNAAIKGVSVSGTILFTFLMSVKTSRQLAFSNGPLPIVIGILSFMIPLIIGNCFRYLNLDDIDPNYMSPNNALAERLVIVSSQSSILLPTVVYILFELKILNSELGRFVLSASMVNDILGVTVSVLAYSVGTYQNISPITAYRDLIAILIFILFVFFVFRPIVEWIIERTQEGNPVEEKYIHFVILIALGSSAYTTFFNMEYALGPFLVGLVVPGGPPLGSALEAKYEKLAMNVLLPISIAASTMRCDVTRIIYEFNDIQYNIFLIVVTLIAKLVAGFVPCLYCKLPIKESLAISIILCTKSFAEIFLYETSYDVTYLSQATYTLLVIYALLSAGIVPVILRNLYDPKRKYTGYRKKNVLHLKPNSELRILACLHRPENISDTIALLQLLSSPKQDFPLVVTTLHLVKLVGHFVPVLISHNKKSKRLIQNSYIHTANLAFKEFEQDNTESTTVTMFTSFSYENLMHQEICNLSLDQTTSMIIVPSGRKWTTDGTFESDNETIRRLNASLLDHAPCSIGILVDRGHFSRRGKKRSYKTDVGLIFIGGKDDREALSLVNRMKQNSCVHVTIIRIVFEQEMESANWEYILDNELLKEIKDAEAVNGVGYEEKIVTNGPELATAVRLLTEKYDLLVVGKDHSVVAPVFSGLTEWIELPELGVIGDLLATKELCTRVSVLVVQQEQHGT